MSIAGEIEEVAEGMVEAPDRGTFKQKQFSSGQDNWLGTPVQEETTKLIKCAKAGCPGAKMTLMDEPFNIRELILDGQVIIQKATNDVHQKPLH